MALVWPCFSIFLSNVSDGLILFIEDISWSHTLCPVLRCPFRPWESMEVHMNQRSQLRLIKYSSIMDSCHYLVYVHHLFRSTIENNIDHKVISHPYFQLLGKLGEQEGGKIEVYNFYA